MVVNMENYTFIYKDAVDNWGTATSIKFVAAHQKCRAILTEDILNEFKTVKKFIKLANEYPINQRAYNFISSTVLREIY